MNTRIAISLMALVPCQAFGAYQYQYTGPLYSLSGNWAVNGDAPSMGSSGFSSGTSSGTAMLYTQPMSDGTTEYEIASKLTITASDGRFVQYLSASDDALLNSSGTFYAVELTPTVSNGACTAQLRIVVSNVNGVQYPYTTQTPCRSGMLLRSVIWHLPGMDLLAVFIDSTLYVQWILYTPMYGKPGIGMHDAPVGNSISSVSIGVRDRIAPAQVVRSSLGIHAFPNSVDMQWQGGADDANGIGIWLYRVTRSDNLLDIYVTTPTFSDTNDVRASTSYTYSIMAIDYHQNISVPLTVNVTTPPASFKSPLRNGVRPGGTYWGAGGEQIDTLSGNLNFSLPLFTVKGRGGVAAKFGLSYNSQMWRKDDGGTWKFGRDGGYGYGWHMQAGSITPF